MTVYAEVIFALPLDRSFFYLVPGNSVNRVEVGSRVLVPFHKRFLTGFVISLRQKKPSLDIEFKEIAEVLEGEPTFTRSFLAFTRKLSAYYYSSWGEVLQTSLPPSMMVESKTRIGLSPEVEVKMKGVSLTRHEREILEFLKRGSYSQAYLKRRFRERNISSLLSRLEKRGLIEQIKDISKQKSSKSIAIEEVPSQTQLEIDFSLDAESHRAAQLISKKIGNKKFSPFLLQAEAEKREAVYFSVIRSSLAGGRRILFMLPEIALTQNLVGRFKRKLGERACVWHSRLPENKRLAEWDRIRAGRADVVIGPRSALLSPIDHLGLIIVDEEHDTSFYQRQSPVFDARKGAWIRAKHEGLVMVYGSSFPSVEAMYRAKKRGYFIDLNGQMSSRRSSVIKERGETKIFAPEIVDKIRVKLEKNEPVIVFCNRRGYASFLSCLRCHFIPRCIHCKIALTYHRKAQKLICHYCQYSQKYPDVCPECGFRNIRRRGQGIEAVVERLRGLFPQHNVVSFDKDAAGDRVSQERILDRFSKGGIDILIGTQLLAHQYKCPQVSLVVIYRPEMALALSDYRAGQNLYHAIRHMMRFLKDTEDAELLIQTSLPDHFSIHHAAVCDHLGFYKQEIRYRRVLGYPPFNYLAEIIFQGENLRNLAKKTRDFSLLLSQENRGVDVLGPALPAVSRMRGRSQIHIILKAKKKRDLDEALRIPLKSTKAKKSVHVYE